MYHILRYLMRGGGRTKKKENAKNIEIEKWKEIDTSTVNMGKTDDGKIDRE